ncbi:MAG TPA: hypothetical protein VKQ89_04745 [Candidatus Angelobacter sp.]|nr:hypothetical protein [Candidatus Angelobacter sp.]
MVGAHLRVFFLLFFLSTVIYIHAQQPLQMASLQPGRALVWQRTSPSAEKPDGPVLYQILFRSSAHIGSIPKIGPSYTLVDSGLLLDNSGNLVIGGLTINGSTGVVTFPAQQSSGNSTQDFWSLGGNTGTTPGTNRLGTNDNQPFELWVNGSRAFRIEPQTDNFIAFGPAPNVIGGSSFNAVTNGAVGATIAGGGSANANKVSGNFGSVGGGALNTASGNFSAVGGGYSNTASGSNATVAGGGGASFTFGNTASGNYATVGGGSKNTASGAGSAVAGGGFNNASGNYSFIAAGQHNTTGNPASPGTAGQGAFAAGQYASADQDGCFAWGDNSTTTPTTCGAVNRFVVRAAGGAQFSNGVNVDTSGADGGGFSNNNAANLLVFGGTSGEAIGSQRASGPGTNQYGLDFYTNGFDRMFIDLGGTVHVVGNLTKGGGSFQIDHPLDPANKYLSHSFVESPDMMNIYNGNITTDARGTATVLLPDWFEALNRDFRYQLTVIGEFAQAIIAREVQQNRFTIRTNRPHVKVSWQVTGIRHDAYANAHRIQVEEDKGDKRGTYLHPELFKTSAVAAGGRP